MLTPTFHLTKAAVDACFAGGAAWQGQANTFTASPQTVNIDDDAHKGLVVKAHSATQSADLVALYSSAGIADANLLAAIGANGHASFGSGIVPDPPIIFPLFPSSPYITWSGVSSVITYDGSVSADTISAGQDVLTLSNTTDSGTYFGRAINVIVPFTSSTNLVDGVNGFGATVHHAGSGLLSNVTGGFASVYLYGTGNVVKASSLYAYSDRLTGTGTFGTLYGVWVDQSFAGSQVVTNTYVGVYVSDPLTYGAPNNYGLWIDSQGVFRIKVETTGQAVPALYNANFTKYTPGATNFERVVVQWDLTHNVAEIGTEKGGTGTLRALRLIGAGVQVAAESSVGPDASAAFEIDSTTQGFLPPRMTTTQRNAISSPATGLQIYNTTTNQDEFYNGSAWGAVGSSPTFANATAILNLTDFAL